MGWRAIRMGLDRPGAAAHAGARPAAGGRRGASCALMIPMVSAVGEVDAVRALIDRELALLARQGHVRADQGAASAP